jgi:hypothetical protein
LCGTEEGCTALVKVTKKGRAIFSTKSCDEQRETLDADAVSEKTQTALPNTIFLDFSEDTELPFSIYRLLPS